MSAREELRNVICAQAVNDSQMEAKLDAYRAEVLREAAEAAVRAARGCGDSETGQYAASVVACVARKLRRMADAAVAGEDR